MATFRVTQTRTAEVEGVETVIEALEKAKGEDRWLVVEASITRVPEDRPCTPTERNCDACRAAQP